jgi:hypothetical protein
MYLRNFAVLIGRLLLQLQLQSHKTANLYVMDSADSISLHEAHLEQIIVTEINPKEPRDVSGWR